MSVSIRTWSLICTLSLHKNGKKDWDGVVEKIQKDDNVCMAISIYSSRIKTLYRISYYDKLPILHLIKACEMRKTEHSGTRIFHKDTEDFHALAKQWARKQVLFLYSIVHWLTDFSEAVFYSSFNTATISWHSPEDANSMISRSFVSTGMEWRFQCSEWGKGLGTDQYWQGQISYFPLPGYAVLTASDVIEPISAFDPLTPLIRFRDP
jgi:hypothetical protein